MALGLPFYTEKIYKTLKENGMGFVELELAGKKALERYPIIKRSAKRVYQLASVVMSGEKLKSEGDLVKVSPDDEYEYFYGYYDKSPWDATDRYMLCIRVQQAFKSVAPAEPGVVGVIDTEEKNRFIEIGITHSWNVQQSCMAQWMGPDFRTKIIYNDFRAGKYCSVIYNWEKREEEKVLPLPVYDVARDGSFALSLDFSRLHRLRPGYGYSNLADMTKGELCPDKPCIWKMNLINGEITDLFKYTDFAGFEPDESMIGAEHKVNHLMISPNGKRFMVLHRWFQKGRKHTRLITVNVDKTDMYNLSDSVFVSHCYWKNDNEILSFLRKEGTGDHYYLLKDRTQSYQMLWPELSTDGHCSYSPDLGQVITDTYPNRKRLASVYLCTDDNNTSTRIARVFAPFRYDNDCRCDLHPRWNHLGNQVCIDSVHEGKRKLYVIPVEKSSNVNFVQMQLKPMVSVIIPCYNAALTIPRTLKSLENQTYKNFEVVIIDDGSTDNLCDVIDKYKGSLNVVYEYQNNCGVSNARNHGIELAKGKYICFVDSDDVYSPIFLEKSLDACERLGADTVLSYFSRDINKVETDYSTVTVEPKAVNISIFMEHFMYNKEHITFCSLLYLRDILNEQRIRFTPNTKYGEDLEFAWKYMINCQRGIILYEKMYGYYDNPNSAVNTVKWEKTDLVDAMLRVQKYMNEHHCEFEPEFSDYFLPRTVWTTAKTFAKGKRKDLYDKFRAQYDVRGYMKSLAKHSRNGLLKISSIIYLISHRLYFMLIDIIYNKIKNVK